jgi:uncharacterized protein
MASRAWSVGVNYTSSRHLATITALIDAGCVDYVEILIDNFLTVPAGSILDRFAGIPIAFHVMNSKFLEADRDTLRAMAVPLRALINAVEPLYVSDHVGRFSYEGRALPILGEYDYRDVERAVSAVDQWQTLLGTRLILENFPSYGAQEAAQPAFFEQVQKRTGAGLLFDISNAVVARHNADVPIDAWHNLIDTCSHFHLGGYRDSNDAPHLLLDTHDRGPSDETMKTAASIFARGLTAPMTLTVEFDRNIETETWAHALRWAASLNPRHAAAA